MPAATDAGPVLSNHRGVFDFNVVTNFARDYLATYYCQEPTEDERAVLAFLARHCPDIESQPCALEIGCGPTVHHVLALAPYVSGIDMADYLPENLEQVRLWKDAEPAAHDWREYTHLILRLEGRTPTASVMAAREAETRGKIRRLLPIDLKTDTPLGTPSRYPVVGCFYCAENIGITKEEWARVMRRVAGLTAPGGRLLLCALDRTHFYVVRTADGQRRRLPSAYLTEADFRELLPTLGFDRQQTVVESTTVMGQEGEGLKGVILVSALRGLDAC
jgi:hypothetical protein